jgi:hypothetical protein
LTFAAAKVCISDESFSHLFKTVVRKKLGGVLNVPVSMGLPGTLALFIWLVGKLAVPLHRQKASEPTGQM